MSAKIEILPRLLDSLGGSVLQEKRSSLPLIEKPTQGKATASFAPFFYSGVMEMAGFVTVVLFLMSMLSLWEPHGFFSCTQATFGDPSSMPWLTPATLDHEILCSCSPLWSHTCPACHTTLCILTFSFGGHTSGYTELTSTFH